MTTHDPFELLSEYSVLITANLPGPNSPAAAASLRGILSTKRPRYRTPSRRALRIAIAVTIAVGAIAATYIATRAEPPAGASVGCFNWPITEIVALGHYDNPTTDACVPSWQNADIAQPGVVPGEVPPLIGCVHPSGTLWVFPGDDASICIVQGLSVAEYQQPTGGPSPVAAMDEVIETLARPACFTQDEAVGLARDIIKEHKLKNWEVRAGDFRPGECAAPAFDPKERLITISSA